MRDGGFEDRNQGPGGHGQGSSWVGVLSRVQVRLIPSAGSRERPVPERMFGAGGGQGSGSCGESQQKSGGVGTRLPLPWCCGFWLQRRVARWRPLPTAPSEGKRQRLCLRSSAHLPPGGPLAPPLRGSNAPLSTICCCPGSDPGSPWRGPRCGPQKLGLGFSPHSAHPPRRKAEIWDLGATPGPSGLG